MQETSEERLTAWTCGEGAGGAALPSPGRAIPRRARWCGAAGGSPLRRGWYRGCALPSGSAYQSPRHVGQRGDVEIDVRRRGEAGALPRPHEAGATADLARRRQVALEIVADHHALAGLPFQ